VHLSSIITGRSVSGFIYMAPKVQAITQSPLPRQP
jgi:hypothetical protein